MNTKKKQVKSFALTTELLDELNKKRVGKCLSLSVFAETALREKLNREKYMRNRKQLWINDNLYTDVQYLAFKKGFTIKAFVEKAIWEALENEGIKPIISPENLDQTWEQEHRKNWVNHIKYLLELSYLNMYKDDQRIFLHGDIKILNIVQAILEEQGWKWLTKEQFLKFYNKNKELWKIWKENENFDPELEALGYNTLDQHDHIEQDS